MLKVVFLTFFIFFGVLLSATSSFCFDDELDKDATELEIKLDMLKVYFEIEMYEEASNELGYLMRRYPDEPKFIYLQALIDYKRGDYDSAEEILLSLSQLSPETAQVYYFLGEIYLQRGDWEKAREYIQNYCKLVPEDYQAYEKLVSIGLPQLKGIGIMKNGQRYSNLVKKIGFYGGCQHSYQDEAIKLVNAKFFQWSSMGIDFIAPVDLRKKKIVFKIKGKSGGERLKLTFRDNSAFNFEPQLVLTPKEPTLSSEWQLVDINVDDFYKELDPSQVVHIGLEFGTNTTGNPANATLYVKDIVIENADN